MEASLTPLMEAIEARSPGGARLQPAQRRPPAVHGRHIELGVKGRGEAVDARPMSRRCAKGWSASVRRWP
jgi:hypothetical protein